MFTDRRFPAAAARVLALALLLGLALLGGVAAQPAAAQEARQSLLSKAVAFIHTLAEGDFKRAEADFTGEMKQAAPPDKLGDTWRKVLAQIGPFEDTGETQTVVRGGYTTVIVRTDFKREALGIAVSFDSAHRIAGMHFVPPP